MAQLTEDQFALLVYIESRVVDHSGNLGNNKRPGDNENKVVLLSNHYISQGEKPNYYRLSIKGWVLAHNLRQWLGNGGTYKSYPFGVDDNGEIGY